MKAAIMIDGGFFQKRANELWGPEEYAYKRVDQLMCYCDAHLAREKPASKLYRIFYYDCPPLDEVVIHPKSGNIYALGTFPIYSYMQEFHNELLMRRKVALRRGRIAVNNPCYVIRPRAQRQLCEGKKTFADLKESDFMLSVRQKGVDMRLGLDIASMAYKKQVDQIILISGDSDFVPAAKLARREGVDFILDSMGKHINADLKEHIDGWCSPVFSLDDVVYG